MKPGLWLFNRIGWYWHLRAWLCERTPLRCPHCRTDRPLSEPETDK
jgi:hypothetical protein